MSGCTSGAKVLVPGHEYILFKNRDFKRAHFDDRVTLTGSFFGVLGLETWDGNDPQQDRYSGFSVGFNAYLACCDSNVRTLPDGDNYDKLVQAVVENCSTIEQAVACVGELGRQRLFCWANMLVATTDGVAALEVRNHHVEVERNPLFLTRANHHSCLGATLEDDDTTTSGFRYQSANQGLAVIDTLDEVFPLLRSHEPDSQHSICNHGFYDTVYSYVVHWKDGETTFYVAQGHPCTANQYVQLPIRLGQVNELSRYPSRYIS
jgi:hypothetical protein